MQPGQAECGGGCICLGPGAVHDHVHDSSVTSVSIVMDGDLDLEKVGGGEGWGMGDGGGTLFVSGVCFFWGFVSFGVLFLLGLFDFVVGFIP